MRTTIDIPETILRQAKAEAALLGIRLKDFVTEAVVTKLRGDDRDADRVREEAPQAKTAWKKMGQFTIPVTSGNREVDLDLPARIAAMEEDEDLERYGDPA